MKQITEQTAAILNLLDSETKQRVIDTLTAYDSVLIDFENGRYKIGALCLRDKYPADFRSVGKILNTDIYTNQEIEINTRNL